MPNIFKYTCTFVVGAMVGAFIAKKYITRHDDYEYVNNDKDDSDDSEVNNIESEKPVSAPKDTIDTLKSVYRSEERVDYNKAKKIMEEEREGYEDLIEDLGYNEKEPLEETVPDDPNRPYNISPDEFLAIDDYDSDSFTYYADGYVTDSSGMPMEAEDIDRCLGFGFESYFGTYDEDEIWIRNERLKMDFSVARDIERFADCAPDRIKRMVGI